MCECGIFADLLISICRWSYSIVGVALGVTFGWRGAFGWGWSIGCGIWMGVEHWVWHLDGGGALGVAFGWGRSIGVWQLHVNHVLSPQSTQPKPS